MSTIEVTELLGDGIGPELRESVYTIAEALPLDLKFIPFDLSLENRESSNSRDLYEHVYQSMNRTKLAIKYPTVTKSSSPNAVIRRMCSFSVILRPVISIKGIKPGLNRGSPPNKCSISRSAICPSNCSRSICLVPCGVIPTWFSTV